MSKPIDFSGLCGVSILRPTPVPDEEIAELERLFAQADAWCEAQERRETLQLVALFSIVGALLGAL